MYLRSLDVIFANYYSTIPSLSKYYASVIGMSLNVASQTCNIVCIQ